MVVIIRKSIFPNVRKEIRRSKITNIALDSGANGFNGIYDGVILGGNDKRAYLRGDSISNSSINLYSLGLANVFDCNEMTFLCKFKTSNPDFWVVDEFASRFLYNIWSYNSGKGEWNVLALWRGSNHQLSLEHNLVFSDYHEHRMVVTSLDWITIGYTVSYSKRELKVYLNGTQHGNTESISLQFSGILSANTTVIGTEHSDSFGIWPGWTSDFIYSWAVPATPTQMLLMYNKLNEGTLLNSDLDSIFGETKYAWWKLNES